MAHMHRPMVGKAPASQHSAPPTASPALACDWMESHLRVLTFWEERLVADNADFETVDLFHRQSLWLQMMLDRLGRG